MTFGGIHHTRPDDLAGSCMETCQQEADGGAAFRSLVAIWRDLFHKRALALSRIKFTMVFRAWRSRGTCRSEGLCGLCFNRARQFSRIYVSFPGNGTRARVRRSSRTQQNGFVQVGIAKIQPQSAKIPMVIVCVGSSGEDGFGAALSKIQFIGE